MLPSFPDGRAIVSAKDLRRPIIVNIRARKSKHGGGTGEAIIHPRRIEVKLEEPKQLQPQQTEEDLQKVIRNDLQPDSSLVNVTKINDGYEVRAVGWLETAKWIKINNILLSLGFEWIKQGRNSRWFRRA